MESYLALCPDIEIAEVYTDNGISGRTFERAGFQKMLADINTGKTNCVVMKDLSRLGCNAIDAGFLFPPAPCAVYLRQRPVRQ